MSVLTRVILEIVDLVRVWWARRKAEKQKLSEIDTMSETTPSEPVQPRIESRQLLEALGMLAAMGVLTLLACVGKADGMLVVWLLEGVIIGNEAVTVFRIVEAGRTPVLIQQTKRLGIKGISEQVETRQWVETAVTIAGIGLVGLMAFRGVVDANAAVYVIEIAFMVFAGVTGVRVAYDRKGLLVAGSVVKAIGDFSNGDGSASKSSSTESLPSPQKKEPAPTADSQKA